MKNNINPGITCLDRDEAKNNKKRRDKSYFFSSYKNMNPVIKIIGKRPFPEKNQTIVGIEKIKE